jgi:tetratricopeptide (TPR) repeat protein
MEQDTTSFWTDIKKFEDILAKDPNSYCFAPLADLYRKLGLLDDAIAIARRGNELHPEFVSGCLVLGHAYLEKGMRAESLPLLEKVVRSTPENIQAQKLLSQLYVEAGDIGAAERALQIILSFNPDDVESRVLLESLSRTARVLEASEARAAGDEVSDIGTPEDEEFIIEDAELLEELDVEEELVEEMLPPPTYDTGANGEEPLADSFREGRDPLTTGTLAELYVSQGFTDRAIAIYQELLQNDPTNEDLRARLRQLEAAPDVVTAVPGPEIAAAGPTAEIRSQEVSAPPTAEPAAVVPGVLETLEKWLENIKRRA